MAVNETALLMDELASYLAKKVRNDDDACDLAQEAFLRMHKFQQKQRLDDVRAFLYRTANNLAVDQFRRARIRDRYLSSERVQELADGGSNQYAPSAERTVSAEQELARISEIVDRMPAKVRHAFLLHRGKDFSYSQIAAEMNVSISMVEKYIVSALGLLRQELR